MQGQSISHWRILGWLFNLVLLQLRNHFWVDSVIPLQKTRKIPIAEVWLLLFLIIYLERPCSKIQYNSRDWNKTWDTSQRKGGDHWQGVSPSAHCHWGKLWRLKRNTEHIVVFWTTRCEEKLLFLGGEKGSTKRCVMTTSKCSTSVSSPFLYNIW